MNRTKVTVACQACQKKKVKCTGSAPCTTCSRSGHKCIFSNNAKKRGPRNGNVEVIRTSAHRLNCVLQKHPDLRDQISQMLESNGNNENNSKHSRQSGKSGLYAYLVPKKPDIPIKPQRCQDQEDHQSPFFCKPMPVYPSNMRRDLPSKRSEINGYTPLTSHNISEVVTSATKNTSIKDLTLPPPYSQSSMRKGMSMSVYSSSLGTQLLLPAPDLGIGMDFLQKSLISSLKKSKDEDHVSTDGSFNVKEEKDSVTISLPSLPSPPSYLSSPTSTYCPPTPTSSSSPPLSPRSYTAKRSSIHLLSKPAPWHDYMELDGSY
ncbi:unnamed protein product [Rhizophagus irregularis]|uniref:Zn(2)-C6 fungal-type domain-containing protein n=1 Tax=Rhizophagus irregularis TaxID=588596 RepID=A0A2I1G3X9_9GLOM|nr:hypothetical protein RhiirA4_395803 [Rhizophagus irregularis]CAB4441881.1 unnamed protein product [Rhizophagus irregularis]